MIEVSTSTAGTVVVELSADQAGVLARVLTHYDFLTNRGSLESQARNLATAARDSSVKPPRAEGYAPERWQHALLELLNTSAYQAERAEVVDVPLFKPATAGGVRVITGGQS